MIKLRERMLPTLAGSNPRPPGLQSHAHPTEPPNPANKGPDETAQMYRMIWICLFQFISIQLKDTYNFDATNKQFNKQVTRSQKYYRE